MASTAFINVQVQVEKQTDPATGGITYKVVSASPQPVVIQKAGTIINYELVNTPADILFTGLTLSPASNQFSKPTISTDGRNITLSDVNTEWGNFSRTFEFNGQPEVRGNGSNKAAATLAVDLNDVENRPPPPPPAAPRATES
jgi:hypothetical protein